MTGSFNTVADSHISPAVRLIADRKGKSKRDTEAVAAIAPAIGAMNGGNQSLVVGRRQALSRARRKNRSVMAQKSCTSARVPLLCSIRKTGGANERNWEMRRYRSLART